MPENAVGIVIVTKLSRRVNQDEVPQSLSGERAGCTAAATLLLGGVVLAVIVKAIPPASIT